MTPGDRIQARARRLVRCYPAAWRTRYGEEFTELLIDDLRERPRSLARSFDVVAHGLGTRLAHAGLTGQTGDAGRRVRVALLALLATATLFMVVGMGVWSQLTIGWQWAPPADPGTRAAMWLMTIALGGLATLAVIAAGLTSCVVLWRLARKRTPGLARPAGLTLVAGLVLYVGCHHFGAGWPGTGGHAWPGREVVPGSLARLAWAATLWVSSYWAHPDALRGFPVGELIWMAVSPVAWLTLVAAGLTTVRRLRPPSRLRRAALALACVAVGLMGVFLAGAGSWVLSGGPGPRGLFAVGAIDLIALGLLTAALLTAGHLLRRTAGGRARGIQG